MRIQQVCLDCKSDKLVWDWASGDVVCTGCGLVAQERFIDDRVAYKDYDEYCPKTSKILTSPPIDQTTLKQTKVVNAVFLNEVLEDTHDVVLSIQRLCDKEPAINVSVSKKANITSGIYARVQGLPVDALCQTMNIKTSSFWKATTRQGISQVPERRFQDLLKRTVYSCQYIPKNSEWQVLKFATKILSVLLEKSHIIQGIKPNRLIISIMIIACEVAKVEVTRKDMCSKYKLSMDTLKKHESIIQDVLKMQS